jgi:hypothetical protein
VIARILTLCLIAGAPLADTYAQATGDAATRDLREYRKEEGKKGFDHVAYIRGPMRIANARDFEGIYEAASDAKIIVIGSIADQTLTEVLSRMREHIGKRINRRTKVTADERYALVEIGDRKHDPCCFGTLLFANHAGTWVVLEDILVSH